MEDIRNEVYLELNKYLKSYISQLKHENKSLNTINSYNNTLNSFIRYFIDNNHILSIKDMKPSTIYSFLDYKETTMNKQGELSINTKRLIITHIKSFFRFIEMEADDLYDFSKLVNNINIKGNKSKPKGLMEGEQQKILNYLENEKTEKNNYISFRNALIVKIMLFSGLRVSETLFLRYKDIVFLENYNMYEITVIGKGNKDRTVYLAFDDISDELNELNKYKAPDDFICLTTQNKQMFRSNIDAMLKTICGKCEIEKIGAHKLRHTFAKNYLKRGGNIVHLQKLLGHNDINTTMIYANPHQEDVKNGFSRVSRTQNA